MFFLIYLLTLTAVIANAENQSEILNEGVDQQVEKRQMDFYNQRIGSQVPEMNSFINVPQMPFAQDLVDPNAQMSYQQPSVQSNPVQSYIVEVSDQGQQPNNDQFVNQPYGSMVSQQQPQQLMNQQLPLQYVSQPQPMHYVNQQPSQRFVSQPQSQPFLNQQQPPIQYVYHQPQPPQASITQSPKPASYVQTSYHPIYQRPVPVVLPPKILSEEQVRALLGQSINEHQKTNAIDLQASTESSLPASVLEEANESSTLVDNHSTTSNSSAIVDRYQQILDRLTELIELLKSKAQKTVEGSKSISQRQMTSSKINATPFAESSSTTEEFVNEESEYE